MTRTKQNMWPFSSRKASATRAPKRKKRSGLTVSAASRLAKQAGYRGANFRDWLESKHLEERGEQVIARFGDAYRTGMDQRENEDRAKDTARESKRVKPAAVKAAVAAAKYQDIDEAKLQRHFERGGTLNEYLKANPAKKRRNPSTAAAEAYEDFHGHPSTELVTVKQKVHSHSHLAAAGELRLLKLKGVDGATHKITRFGGAILAFNEARNQLFVRGGDQAINLDDFGITEPHELETLGKLTKIDYATTKSHLGKEGGTAIYQHGFRMTNEDGKHVVVSIARYPDLIYRVLDQQLEFSGGSYTIRREGIDL
jgi:hypothetical protein